MSKMSMTVEFLAGTSIEDAILEAKEKALMFDLAYVKFKFNGISFNVGKKADVAKGVQDYSNIFSSDGNKFIIVN